MTIADVTEASILKLVYQAVDWAGYADHTLSSPQTNIGMSLHTADPGDAGSASTSEIGYTGYTRVNVPRGTATPGWAFTQPSGLGTISPTANIDFPAGSGGSGSAAWFATAASNATPPTGAQNILWSGQVSPPIATGSGVTPRLTTSTTITLD